MRYILAYFYFIEKFIKTVYTHFVNICVDRIAAIPGDCKSPAFGHRWFESNSTHSKKMA